jgi:general secretion pathway protein B
MSLILEALRKSEAERRLGSAPDVLSAMPVMRASAPRSRWPPAFMIVTGMLVLAGALFWWSQRSVGPAPTTVATSAPPQSIPATPPQAPHAAPAIPSVAPPPRPALNQAPHPPVSMAMPTPKPSVPAPVAAPAPVSASAAPIAAPTQTNATNAEPALLSLGDLSAEERAGLPALKVSMHVYADDPARRFMIVDGQRVGEGARLADGVVLVRIRRDGAEIDLRGRRVLLPKP